MNFGAIIWGSCGSLPSPATSGEIRQKVLAALWAAREQTFDTTDQVAAFVDQLPHSLRGTYRANTSCVQIVTDQEDVLLCDAGTGIRDYALSLPVDSAPRTYHIFLSHLHWDHIQGFPFFRPAYKPGNRIVFHGFHPETEAVLRKQMEAPFFPVPFESMQATIEFDIREEGEDFELDGVLVRTIRQNHPGDSWGYRFERKGKAIVYSSDAEHTVESRNNNAAFIDFFNKADVAIVDAQYTREQVDNEKRNWGHSDHITAMELAGQAAVDHLVLFHHEPGFSDEKIESIYQNALQATFNEGSLGPEKITLAYDGLQLEV
ncbi:MAG: MBL fold metallo-hydrolase [Coraliomargaritaceae bacterium]